MELRPYAQGGTMRRFPETLPTRTAAMHVLWDLAESGQADVTRDARYRTLVLLAASGYERASPPSERSGHGGRAGEVEVRLATQMAVHHEAEELALPVAVHRTGGGFHDHRLDT